MCVFAGYNRKIHRDVPPTNPFYGFKSLEVRSTNLYSEVMRTPWIEGKLSGPKPHTTGRGPGIYAFSSTNSFWLRPTNVVVEVALWGKVVEYFSNGKRRGFMAEHAEIHVVYTSAPDEIKKILAHTDITVKQHSGGQVLITI